jgi:phytanoyl-CoA hydroxylase
MLTQDQLDFFHTNGYLIMRSVIQGSELEMLREAADHVIKEGIAHIGESDHRYVTGPEGNEVYWRSERMWERDDIFRAVTVNPDLLENIGQCIAQPFYPWNDSLVVKLPNSGAAVKWHQDPPYRNPHCEVTFPVPNFTSDIYLDHSGPDNGCVYAMPGHHLVGNIKLEQYSEDELFQMAVPLEMEAGDVLFHCLSTPHGSHANLSSTIRRIFYIHYLSEEVYQDGYASEEWAKEKPGWSADRYAQIEQMTSERESLGLETPFNRPSLRLESSGISFRGKPSTAYRQWGDLAKSISNERKLAQKRLAG